MTSNPPVIAMKPSSETMANSFAIKTSREWVLPPRPKPGRKADTDNAPTKRKAQNREAQRAFRERRAARVGELEQQIRDIEAAHRKELESLEVDNGRLKLENVQLKDAVDNLMRELSTIRSLTKLSQSPVHAMQTPTMTPDYGRSLTSPAVYAPSTNTTVSPLGFETLSQEFLGQSVPLKRRRGKRAGDADGTATPKCKRLRQSPLGTSGSASTHDVTTEEMDMPFSAASFKPPAGESCGFCSDGTPCLCAEAAQQYAMAEERLRGRDKSEVCEHCAQTLPCLCSAVASARGKIDRGGDMMSAVLIDAEQHDAQQAAKSSLKNNKDDEDDDDDGRDNGLCTGNPGSCRQCQFDPMSTLFCTTLAGNQSTSSQSAMPSVTADTKSSLSVPTRPSLLHQSSTFSTSSARDSTPPLPGDAEAFIPCSTAYRALARHENFKGSDMDSIVRGLDVDRTSGRGVQVGSVRDVLRILDRGLGRDI